MTSLLLTLLTAVQGLDAQQTFERCEVPVLAARELKVGLRYQIEGRHGPRQINYTLNGSMKISSDGRVEIDMATPDNLKTIVNLKSSRGSATWVNVFEKFRSEPIPADFALQCRKAFTRFGLVWTILLQLDDYGLDVLDEPTVGALPPTGLSFGPTIEGRPSVQHTLLERGRIPTSGTFRLHYDAQTFTPVRRELTITNRLVHLKVTEIYDDLVLDGRRVTPVAQAAARIEALPPLPAPGAKLSEDEVDGAYIVSRIKVAQQHLAAGRKDAALSVLRAVIREFPDHQQILYARKQLEAVK